MIYLTRFSGARLPYHQMRGPFARVDEAAMVASQLVESGMEAWIELWHGGTMMATFTRRVR